jgi:hypothetical protein
MLERLASPASAAAGPQPSTTRAAYELLTDGFTPEQVPSLRSDASASTARVVTDAAAIMVGVSRSFADADDQNPVAEVGPR